MPSPSSLSALSRLSSLTPRGGGGNNAFFDPTGEDFDQLQDEWRASDAEELRTGLNPTARYTQATQRAADEQHQREYEQQRRREVLRRADADWLGPEGWARSSPQEATGARDLALGDARVAHDAANLPTVLHMAREKALAEGQNKSDTYWQPGTQSMLESESRRQQELYKTRYVDPVQTREAGDLAEAEIRARASRDVAQTHASSQQTTATTAAQARALAAALQRGDITADPATIAMLQKALGANGGAAATPDLSGLLSGHGRTFNDGPFAGQTWTIGPDGQPQRVR